MVERHSASQCLTRIVKGLHRFTLEKYSLCKGVGQGQTVGGHQWVVTAFPDGTYGGDRYEEGYVYVGLHVSLMSESAGVHCLFKMTLLDQSGKGNHLTLSLLDNVPDAGPILIAPPQHVGFPCFIRRDFLEKSCYLKTGEGSDVVFSVRGEKFCAHKVILSARSSVLEFMFASHLVSDQQELVIIGVESRVFKALLHFIYSDALPEDERSLADGYAFGPSLSGTFGAK
ncbi:hypothetical protein Pfo_010973 [Paulownia fortunei]|nr:hypothetical protein Pfo_010973 [Paulownia fortunei]